MAQRRYGPTQDAGTVIIEKDAEKSIDPSAFGSTAYVGIMERGTPGEVITTTSKRDMLRKTGGYIPDSLLPDANVDFWDESSGAGALFLYRVTDGSEEVASLTLWDRKAARNKVVRVDAHDGGWWGGRRDTVVCDVDNVTDIGYSSDETKIKLPDAYVVKKNKWKGGTVTIHGPTADFTYEILSNTAGDGVTGAILTLAADSTADTDYDTSTDTEIVLKTLSANDWSQEKHLAVKISDGQVNPSTEWGMTVYLNGELVKEWPDLSSDPNADNYFVNIINDDDSNHYVQVTDLWSGAITAATRPANFYTTALASTAVTALGVDFSTVLVVVDSSLAGANTIGTFTYGADVIEDTYEIEREASDWAVTSLGKQAHHTFPDASDGTPYAADNPQSFGFTITESGASLGEKFTVYVLPMWTDEAIGGRVFFPDESFAPAAGWQISDNDEKTVSILTGDMTNGGALSGDIAVRLEYAQQLVSGYEGIWDIDDNDFLPAFDKATSPFNDLLGQGYGWIKFATPGIQELSGVTPAAVQIQGIAYAEDKNWQFRFEFPSNYTDEANARDYVNNTIGRNDFERCIFPSYVTVTDPVLGSRTKLVPVTGMVHGYEAKNAYTWDGYHKVAAGEDAKLSKIRSIPTGDTKLNGEMLNGAGIQRIERRKGNYVIWGARIPFLDSAYKFTQHRELMSYYEHVLSENYDWIIFAINDALERPKAKAQAKVFFDKEKKKRALKTDAEIKIDEENNTAADEGAGDMNMEVTLNPADTVERFIITVGKKGVFETTASV